MMTSQSTKVSREGRIGRGRRRARSLASKYLFRFLAPISAASMFFWNDTSSQLSTHSHSKSTSVIIQMFEWNWDSIAEECTAFIGPAGYGYIQVSPPQEHIRGPQWWTSYQPVSYTLDSKYGNRAQFINMINTCHAAGVGVIVDTIWNHMAGIQGGIGTAGNHFTHYEYPAIYRYDNFHHCGITPGDVIRNYYNRLEVQTCELVHLADLATETEYVRSRLAEYTNDLLSLGVDGLRLDAVKHIAAEDISNIVSRLSRKTYITQEVLFGNNEPISPLEYVQSGSVQEFRYTSALKDAFLREGIANLRNLDDRGWISDGLANVFVTNHDTERNGNSLNFRSPSNTYITSHVFSLAHPFGIPTVLSSYSFTEFDQGAPNNGHGSCSLTGGRGGWLCQHRSAAISGMVGFRNNVGTAPIMNWFSPESQRIAFGRGSGGYVAINNADVPWTADFLTSLPDGHYCDVISGVSSEGSCTGSGATVVGGLFSATVAARSAFAIHIGARGVAGPPNLTVVTFSVIAETVWGENLFLVGSPKELGNWNINAAVALSPASYPVWTAIASLPARSSFEYKFIRKKPNGTIVWQSGPNRQAVVVSTGTQTISSSW